MRRSRLAKPPKETEKTPAVNKPVNRIATNGHAYYAVTPGVEVAWRELLVRVAREADVAFDFLSNVPPQTQGELWSRADPGYVFVICGYPIAMHHLAVTPIAAPIPLAPWAQGRALYRSDLIVRTDSHFQTLPDTFGGRLGWTTKHSHSAFNALRHHLLRYRNQDRGTLYSHVIGALGSVRMLFDAVCDGTIDVGSVDSYWHLLLQRYQPELAARVRVLESTATAPMPAFVASPLVAREIVDRLMVSFTSAHHQNWFHGLATAVMIAGFAPSAPDEFTIIRAREQEAIRAGYPLPA